MTAVIHVEQALGGGLGASQAAQALGLCPPSWGAPIDLWCQLTGRMARTEPGQAARWGQLLEPLVRGVYVERHQLDVDVPPASMFHRGMPWLRATPDGIALRDGKRSHLVQVKCPGLRQAPSWGTEERRELPLYYRVQATVEMAVTGLDRVDFAVLLGGQEYFELTVIRDEELEWDVLDGLRAFWRCVETDIAPAVDGSEGYGRYLATLAGERDRKAIDADDATETIVARWREVRQALAMAESEDSLIRNRLLAYATANRAKQIRSQHGTVPVVESAHTSRGWEALAREYARQLGTDADADIEPHTRRKPTAFVRAPGTWSKET